MKRTILLLDDNEDVVSTCKGRLNRMLKEDYRIEKLEILETSNAHEAWGIVETQALNFALLDINIAKTRLHPSGISLGLDIQRQFPHVGVGLMSGYKHHVDRALAAGFSHVWHKNKLADKQTFFAGIAREVAAFHE